MLTSLPAWSETEDAMPHGYAEGVQAYREGNYAAARKNFERLHNDYPENSRVTYYLAITEAQLSRFQQARQLYQEILTLDPNSEAAKLAKEGLDYLPEAGALDEPPKFKAKSRKQPETAETEKAVAPQNAANPASVPQNSLYGGMSPQDMMMLQMMMSQGGGAGGMNPMMYMMAPQGQGDPNNPNGMGNIDTSIMSNVIMNQMLQNFSLDSGKDQDR